MAVFTKGVPITTTPPNGATIEVTLTPTAPLAKGLHHFQLVVEDDDGNQSDPVSVPVEVKDTQKPKAVLTAPAQVQPGQSFTLDGSQSTDVLPGTIAKWIWTMLD